MSSQRRIERQAYHRSCPAGPQCDAARSEKYEWHALWHGKRLQECADLIEEARRECPRCPELAMYLANCLAAMRREAAAERIVNALLRDTGREDAFLLHLKGRLVERRHGAAKALPWYREALGAAVIPYAGYLMDLARAHWDGGEQEEAARLATEALQQSPKDAAIVEGCVRLLLRSGRSTAALHALRQLAQVDCGWPDFYVALAAGFRELGCRREASTCVRRALKLSPDDVAALCIGADVSFDLKRFRVARRHFQRLLAVDPVSHGTYCLLNLATIHRELGDWRSALNSALEARRLFPDDEDTRRSLEHLVEGLLGEAEEARTAGRTWQSRFDQIRKEHETLRQSLAGFDTSEAGTNLSFALAEGESEHVEFMACFPEQVRDLAHEMAALATIDGGGTIFVGVTDEGRVVGCAGLDSAKGRDCLRMRVANIASRTVQPPVRVGVYFNRYDNLTVVKVWVPQGPEPVYYVDGAPYIRNLTESRKATPPEVTALVTRHLSRGSTQ